MTRLSYTVVWFGTFVILVSLFFSFLVKKKKASRKYMKNFFFYPLIAILLSINTILGMILFIYSSRITFLIQIFLFLFDLVFWCSFFSIIFKNKTDSTIIKWIFCITVLIEIALFQFSNLNETNLHTISLINICKAFFCIFFYYKLFKNVPTQNIKLEPSFWIVTGLFFYSCLSIPFYALNDYIRSLFTPTVAANIFATSNIFVIIMHLFFIKAYLCTIRLNKAL
jgi:hypothetical protein